jgi:hypothetical protein
MTSDEIKQALLEGKGIKVYSESVYIYREGFMWFRPIFESDYEVFTQSMYEDIDGFCNDPDIYDGDIEIVEVV